jgi:hypothetical protein
VAANATSRTPRLRARLERERDRMRIYKSHRQILEGGRVRLPSENDACGDSPARAVTQRRSHKHAPAVTTNVVKTSGASARRNTAASYRAVARPAAKATRSFSTRRAVAYTSRQIAANTAACADATGSRPSPIVRLTAATKTG